MKSLVRVLSAIGACAAPVVVCAQGAPYPVKPVRVIVPYPAGGGTDLVMRAIQPVLAERLGQPVVIDNRPGATGAIGSEIAAHSTPDGYTLLAHTSGGLAIAPHTMPQIRFDPRKDFAPISQITSSPFVLLVHPKLAATSVAELVALARAKPGALNYSSSGVGSSTHLSALLLCKLTGVNMVHVAYKGSGPATADLVAGHVQLRFSSIPPAMPHVKSGRLRALATTGAKRFSLLPELPAVAETVPGYVVDSWYVVLAPAKTSSAIVAKLNTEVNASLQSPDVRSRLRSEGVEAVGTTPQHAAKLIAEEFARWGPLVKEAGAKAD
ncbi:MAG TPA: tripartite tricarboxylate transporter substrate binding protein [Burkholderiales bacterium]|nr:tripartite tricarboxylate transporter substrate binding protein [Burkholderiales bacterium]